MTISKYKTGAVAAALVLALGSAATPALARGGFHHGGGGFHGGGFHQGFARSGGFHDGGWRHNRDYAGGGYYGGYGYGGLGLGLAAGVIGGALLASQAPYYGYTDYGYSAAYPGYGSGGAQAYCQSRFKSYNPATGTYLGYDGLRHSCP